MPGRGGSGRGHFALAITIVILEFLLFADLAGMGAGFLLSFITCLPVFSWLIVGSRRKSIAKHITRSVRRDLKLGHSPRYLKGKHANPEIGRRTLTVIVAVFGLTAVVLRFILKPLFPAYFQNFYLEVVTYAFLSLLVLAILPFILIPAWAKNDAGLRLYNREKLLVTAPGSNMVRFITGIGLLTSLVYVFNTPFSLMSGVAVELLFAGPACYLSVAAFGGLLERRLTAYIEGDSELNSELSLSIDFTGQPTGGLPMGRESIIRPLSEQEHAEHDSE